ncbi:MAG: DNA recombination protein RmuC [Rhodospirillaceae bacterium]|nr:DNA recombination protein RmuC [Rhodospirillaceae bacterium]
MIDTLAIVISLVIGLLLGGGAYYLLAARAALQRQSELSAELAALKTAAETAQREREALIAARSTAEATAEAASARAREAMALSETLRGERDDANIRRSSLETALRSERDSHAARVEELQRMGEEIKKNFVVLAGDALGKNSEGFLQLVTERFQQHNLEAAQRLAEREKAVETLVKPLSESLSKFDSRVGEIEKAREGAYGALQEQLRALSESQISLRTETGRLVQALRSPKTRGRWGELQLRTVLELAGMTQNVDFVEQSTLNDESGALRPDAVVRLPGGKSVVIDAKTPLDAYLNAIEADEEARPALLAQHARQLRQHARDLGSKEYWRRLSDTPDFVVMFVPGEVFFTAAIEADSKIYEDAIRNQVVIATPMTLLTLIRVVAFGWQQERFTKNAQEALVAGRDLYERIKKFGEHYGKVGDSLKRAVEAFNNGVGSLERRVLPAARRFEALGVVGTGETLPEAKQITVDASRLTAPELAGDEKAPVAEN